MNESRQSGRLDPGPVWTMITGAPLRGLALAREAGRVLAWDEGDQVYLIDARGETIAAERMPAKINAAAISDDGSLVGLIGGGSKLWLLDDRLGFIEDRAAITDPSALAIDPHGRYVAVASKLNLVQFYTRFGKLSGRFETRQPLGGLCFVADRLAMVGIGAFSMLMGFELTADAESGKLGGDLVWTQNLLSSVGRMTTTGDGSAILVSCWSHGVQRFDGEGRAEGTYHLGGSATQAVPDFSGRMIAVGTMEGELAILNGAGQIRHRMQLPHPPMALEMDGLGRYVVHGFETGEVTKLDLFAGAGAAAVAPRRASAPASAGRDAGSSGGVVRSPDWSIEVIKKEDQSEYTVLAVLDDPPRIGVISPTNKLEVFTRKGKLLGAAPEIQGVGRILRTAPGWIAAATDRMIVLCDCRGNTARKLEMSLVEVTHLALRPDDFGLAIVQERDRIGRATTAGRWVWKRELRQPVEEIAIGPDGMFALTLEDGTLLIHDAAGNPLPAASPPTGEPLLLQPAPPGSPERVCWITLARRAQILRGHSADGRKIWESPVPFEAWQMHGAGSQVVVTAPDGRSIAYDGSGHARGKSRGTGTTDQYAPGPRGPLRIARQGAHLICAEMDGTVAWRSISSVPYGPMGVGAAGVAVMLGKNAAFFGMSPEDSPVERRSGERSTQST